MRGVGITAGSLDQERTPARRSWSFPSGRPRRAQVPALAVPDARGRSAGRPPRRGCLTAALGAAGARAGLAAGRAGGLARAAVARAGGLGRTAPPPGAARRPRTGPCSPVTGSLPLMWTSLPWRTAWLPGGASLPGCAGAPSYCGSPAASAPMPASSCSGAAVARGASQPAMPCRVALPMEPQTGRHSGRARRGRARRCAGRRCGGRRQRLHRPRVLSQG